MGNTGSSVPTITLFRFTGNPIPNYPYFAAPNNDAKAYETDRHPGTE